VLQIEWDESKNKSNYKKHKIWFEEAQQVFNDPLALRYFDSAHSESEDRFLLIGESEPYRVLLVVFCEKDESVIRIISARKATKKERRKYEKGI
jgi:uncharacterized protein